MSSHLTKKLEFKIHSMKILGADPRCVFVEQFVMDHASLRHGRPLGKPYEYGPQKECFSNAARLALDHPYALTYAEGYAGREDLPIEFRHAWCVDRDGLVVDPTWRGVTERDEYLGVQIPLQMLLEIQTRTEQYGVLWTGPLDVPNFEVIELLRQRSVA